MIGILSAGGETCDGKFRMVLVDKREKKTRRPLTLEQRVFALKLLSSGLSARKTAAALGVGRSQIQETLKRRDEIMADWQSDNVNPERKRKSRKTGNEEINSMCLKWYQEAVANGYTVSGPLLQQKALELAVQLGIPSFKASNGWLESFRKRHMIAATGGHSSKTSTSDRKSQTEKEDETTFSISNKRKLNDDAYIQEHMQQALYSLNMWQDGEKDSPYESVSAFNNNTEDHNNSEYKETFGSDIKQDIQQGSEIPFSDADSNASEIKAVLNEERENADRQSSLTENVNYPEGNIIIAGSLSEHSEYPYTDGENENIIHSSPKSNAYANDISGTPPLQSNI